MAGCCDSGGLRVQQIKVGDNLIGIAGLDIIISEVRSRGLLSEEDIKAALFKLARTYNYIPGAAREKYAEALYREYINNNK